MNQTSPMDRVKTITTEKFTVNITQCSIIKIKLIKKVQQTGLHWNFQLTIQLFTKLWRLTWKKVHWERGWEIKQFKNMVMTISEILWNKGLCWTAKVRLWQWIISSQLELPTNSHLTFLKLTTLEDKGTHTELKYFYFLRLYGLILRPVLLFCPCLD